MYCFVGGKGSGKSYSCVQNVCIPAFKSGIPILTNIPLKVDLIRKDFIHADVTVIDEFTENDIINCPAGYILIIDEIQLIFGAKVSYTKISDELLEFFSKSRHKVDKGRAINIVILSQTLDGISKPIKSLIDTLYKCRKLSVVGAFGRYQIKQFEMIGGLIPNKKPIAVANGSYNKYVYQYYYSNSQNTSNSDQVVNIQEKLVKEKTIFSNWQIRIAIFCFFGLLIYFVFFFSFAGMFSGYLPEDEFNLNSSKHNSSSSFNIKVPVNSKVPVKNKIKSKMNKVDIFFGSPKIHLNGININGQDFFSFKSSDYDIPFISLADLRALGFNAVKLFNGLYLINDKLISYPKENVKKSLKKDKIDLSSVRLFANDSRIEKSEKSNK